MIIVMEENATEEQIVRVVDRLIKLGFDIHRSTGSRYTLLGAVGSRITDLRDLELLEGVNKVGRGSAPYKLAACAVNREGGKIEIGDMVIGGEQVVVMAGPGVVENREQMETIAGRLASHGVRVLRGGAFRTSDDPYGFQGLGEEGLKLLREVADRHRMLTHSTIFDISQLALFARYVDIIQVSERYMRIYPRLKKFAKQEKRVFLRRGASSTMEEFLRAVVFVMRCGNNQVLVCGRAIRTSKPSPRHTLDLSAIPVIKKL